MLPRAFRCMLIAALCVPIAPAGAMQDTQDQVLKRICRYQKVDVDSCGGNRFFASDRAREEAERKCASYLVSCMQVVESCQSLR